MEAKFSEKEIAALRSEYAKGLTDKQFDLWITTCERRNLTPVDDVVLQIRSSQEYDDDVKAKVWKKKPVFITTVRALLRLAERTGKYRGVTQTEWIYLDENGNPTVSSIVPLPEPGSTEKPRTPWIARVGVLREGFDGPQMAVARFNAYAQTYEDKDNKRRLNSVWASRGPEQLAKCAMAAALRLAFPEEAGDLYLPEEFPDEVSKQTNKVETPSTAGNTSATTVPTPTANVAPPVNQAPAEGKETPRPGEEAAATTAPPAVSAPAAAAAPTSEPPKKSRTRKKAETAPASAAAPAPTSDPTPQAPPPGPPPADTTGPVDLPVDPPKEPELDPNSPPTKAEGAGISLKLKRPAEIVGSNELRGFIFRYCKKTNVSEITRAEWAAVTKVIESAVDDDDLKSLVKGA